MRVPAIAQRGLTAVNETTSTHVVANCAWVHVPVTGTVLDLRSEHLQLAEHPGVLMSAAGHKEPAGTQQKGNSDI